MSWKFPVRHRLVHAHEFDKVFSECEFRKGHPALLLLARYNHHGFNRLGMVVSKKNVPLSVQRNRIKRLIREAFRQMPVNEDRSLDVLVLVRSKARETKNLGSVLTRSLHALSAKAADVRAANKEGLKQK